MTISYLVTNSWKIIWKNKWIWFSVLLVSLGSYLSTICRSLIFSAALITIFLSAVLSIFGTIGLIYSIYCADSGEPVDIKRLWEVAQKSIGRVLAINFIVGVSLGLSFCLAIYCVLSISSKNLSSLVLLIGLLSSASVFLFSLTSFTTMGAIIENLGVGESIRKGIALFLRHIGFMLLVALMAIGISLFVGLVSVGIGWSLQSWAVSTIISTIGSFLTTPFTQALFVLAYLRFSEAEAAIQRPATILRRHDFYADQPAMSDETAISSTQQFESPAPLAVGQMDIGAQQRSLSAQQIVTVLVIILIALIMAVLLSQFCLSSI